MMMYTYRHKALTGRTERSSTDPGRHVTKWHTAV